MDKQIENILALQTIEEEIDIIRTDAQVFPDQLEKAQKDFDAKETKLNEMQTRIAALTAEHADLEKTLELEEQRLHKSRKKLKEITKPYEFQALKKEIDSTEKSNGDLETQILQKTEDIERAKKELELIQTSYDQSLEKLNAVKEEVTSKMGEFDGQLETKESTVKDLEKACDTRLLSQYRMIRDRKYQDAIVPVIDGACQGCFMNIPPQMANLMMQSPNKVERCPNCQRLIFWQEDVAQEA
jgi:predicted  nucleic acid-binding Zn-ribbon protein